MKKANKILILLAVIGFLTFALPAPVYADAPDDGRTIFGETYTLSSGDILDGDLTVFGGVVNVETDATVTGDVVIFGSVVTIDGTIEGDLSMFGGTLTLDSNAVIEGDLTSASSYISQAPGSVIKGDFTQGLNIPWSELNFSNIEVPQIVTSSPLLGVSSVLTDVAQFLGVLLACVALGSLMVLISPKSVEVMANALVVKPWEVIGYGALTAAAMLVGGILVSLTICLIPVVILVGLAFLLAVLVGWLVLGYQLGKLLETGIFKTTWHPVLTAALGNAVLYLLARGLATIPCLGAVLTFLATLFGLGAAVVTLFGSTPYPRVPKDNQPEVLVPAEEVQEQSSTAEDKESGSKEKENKK